MKISIVSLGWLGKGLHESLSADGHEVTGTFFHAPKGVAGEVAYDFGNDPVPSCVLGADAVIFNLPPSVIKSVDRFERFVREVGDKKLVFVSSTSVYGNQGHVDERSEPRAEKSNGLFLLELEKIARSNCKQALVIRPGGLYGELGGVARHPARYLSGKVIETFEDERVNLIAGADLVRLIARALDLDEGLVINAVNSNHPRKSDYYSHYCERRGLALPIVKNTKGKNHKIVDTIFPAFKIDTPLD